MSDPTSEPHAAPAAHVPGLDAGDADAHAASSVTSGAGHDPHAVADEHAEGEGLGPVDVLAWGAGALGVLVGLGMALAFAIATNRLAT